MIGLTDYEKKEEENNTIEEKIVCYIFISLFIIIKYQYNYKGGPRLKGRCHWRSDSGSRPGPGGPLVRTDVRTQLKIQLLWHGLYTQIILHLQVLLRCRIIIIIIHKDPGLYCVALLLRSSVGHIDDWRQWWPWVIFHWCDARQQRPQRIYLLTLKYLLHRFR